MAITGFSFKKDDSGNVSGVAGKKVLPHRYILIREAINKRTKSEKEISEMFYNFQLPDCRNASSLEELDKEGELMLHWFNEVLPQRQQGNAYT